MWCVKSSVLKFIFAYLITLTYCVFYLNFRMPVRVLVSYLIVVWVSGRTRNRNSISSMFNSGSLPQSHYRGNQAGTKSGLSTKDGWDIEMGETWACFGIKLWKLNGVVQLQWKRIWWFHRKLNTELLYEPAVPLLDPYLKELKAAAQTNICKPMLRLLFIIAKRWE